MNKNPLYQKTTDQAPGQTSNKKIYERLTVSMDETTAKTLETFYRQVRDETGYKITKSDLVQELIKLIPALKLKPYYLGSDKDVKNQFEIITKKLNQLA